MASETYEFLKKIAQGEEISRWEYPDKLISYVDYRSKIPKITITFDDDDDFLDIFDIDRDSDDRYAWAKFMGNYYSDDYDRYRYEDDWDEGYIIQNFNHTNIEKLETILRLTNPTLKLGDDNRSEVAKFLDKMFSSQIDELVYDYGLAHSECVTRAVKETILKDVKNPFYKFGIIEMTTAYKFQTSVKILLKLYNLLEAEDEDLKGLLKLIYEKYGDKSVGGWNELEYNAWCDDYDKESEQENIGKVLDSIIESVEDDLSDEIVDFDEYNKLYAMVLKLGGFNKLIKFPEKNIEVVFEDININTGKLIFKVWKNSKVERRSVDNIDDLNLTLYHPELFESVRRILKKLL